ncbi:MAG: transposase [Desulfobacterales bacterium]|jgi:REP element-mobilizing transposase RayT
MARPLRIEYPDAWYHIMNRGRRSETIFADKRDYTGFIELLKDTTEMWNLRITAYCLMPNHYHLLAQTPDANISRCMRHIDGVYTQRYNRYHQCDGSLFRGRFKSILIDADQYLLQLVRYIHRNPLKANLTDNLDRYLWSSHRGYLSKSDKWNWLHKDFILSMLSKGEGSQLKYYRQFISTEDEDEIDTVLIKKKWPAVLGSADFVQRIKNKFFTQKTNSEVPQSRELAPEPYQIILAVCDRYGVDEKELLISKRGVFNEPRNMAIYLMRRLRGDSLEIIGQQFHIKKYSSVSSVVERMKAALAKNRRLQSNLEQLISSLSKSQEQT